MEAEKQRLWETERKENALDAFAAAIVRDVFRPLLEEFGEALVAAGVFQRSMVSDVLRHKSGADSAAVDTASSRSISLIASDIIIRRNPKMGTQCDRSRRGG